MNSEHLLRAGRGPVHSRHLSGAFFTIVVAIVLSHASVLLNAQTGGGRDLISLDFSAAPLGAPPKELRVTGGNLQVVDKEGVHMLKSATNSTFLVLLPEKIPSHFVLEFNLVPKSSGDTSGPAELSFEGTREVSNSEDSAHIMWNHYRVSVNGGGQDYAGSQIDMPEDLKEEIIGFPTIIRAEFNEPNLTVQTNGRTVFESKSAKFNRGRVVRVELGGADDGENAVYLASMRLVALDGGVASTKGSNSSGKGQSQTASATGTTGGTTTGGFDTGTVASSTQSTATGGDPTGAGTATGTTGTTTQAGTGTGASTTPASVTGIVVSVNSMGGASAFWDPVPGAISYFTVCWNTADPYGAKFTSSPDYSSNGMQVGVLTGAGTYGFRVYAKTASGYVGGETQFSFGVGGSSPTGTPTVGMTGTSSTTGMPGMPGTPDATVTGGTGTTGMIDTSGTTGGTGATGTTGMIDTSGATGGTGTAGTTSTSTGGTSITSLATTALRGLPTSNTPTAPIAPTGSPTGSDLITTQQTSIDPTTTQTMTGVVSTTDQTATLAVQPTTAVTQTATVMPTAVVGTIATPDAGASGSGAVPPGRYRVLITGCSVAKGQADDPIDVDGHGNEIYAAAVVFNWNRSTSQLTSFATAQTLDYGEVTSNGFFGNRIRAGSATLSGGGIVSGNKVPDEYDPAGDKLGAAATDRFPLLVWEGTLTAGNESIVVCPSLWERDASRAQFDQYKSNWNKASPSAIMSSPVIANKSSSSTLAPVIAQIAQSVAIAPPAASFTGLPTNGYKIAGLTFPPGVDRPIGMGLPTVAVLTYQDRFIVITQENVGSIPVGGGVTLLLPLAEPPDPFMGALYTIYVRVERTQ